VATEQGSLGSVKLLNRSYLAAKKTIDTAKLNYIIGLHDNLSILLKSRNIDIYTDYFFVFIQKSEIFTTRPLSLFLFA